jgi:uncharacterized protein (DUF4213/DUF364 family)
MTTANAEPRTMEPHTRLRDQFRPAQAPGASLLTAAGRSAISLGRTTLDVDDLEADVWRLCDGGRTVGEIARQLSGPAGQGPVGMDGRVAASVAKLRRAGFFESIEEGVLRGLLDFHGPDLGGLELADICTGDYFTGVLLSDGSQGAAINFNNVSGPHRVSYNHEHYDDLLLRLARTDGLLLDSFLRRRGLDCLGQSVKVAILNALSRDVATPPRLRGNSLNLSEGYLDLYSFLRKGDTVSMIGCTGNYSCPEVGRFAELRKVNFSDFEYTGPFKSGIEDCIKRFFVEPEKVVLSDGSKNEAICDEADVVVIIADTICTNTLDELLWWSSGAREVLVTGRSYVMDPIHAFSRGASAMTTQRVVREDFIGFLRDKIRRSEFGFTDAVVECFERWFVTEA